MNYLTTKSVLDRVFSRIKDNSSTLRVRMLGWLNSTMQDAVSKREWTFLEKTVSLTITDNAITLPVDFDRELFIRNGQYIFTVGDRLTAYMAAEADIAGGEPYGYTLDATSLTFHPSASGTAELTYQAVFPAAGYEDGTIPTIFPINWLPVFERCMITAFYEYDVDADRLPLSLQLDAEQIRAMKKLDNQRKAIPQLSPKGYVRGQ